MISNHIRDNEKEEKGLYSTQKRKKTSNTHTHTRTQGIGVKQGKAVAAGTVVWSRRESFGVDWWGYGL
jgi:hypothetical protein